MLRLLLDENLSPQIEAQVHAHDAEIDIVSVYEWQGGRSLSEPDDVLLRAAHEQRRTLVTFDQQTIRPLIKVWAIEGRSHSGVIFISGKSIASNNFGALVRAVLALWRAERNTDWRDAVRYLQLQNTPEPGR